MQARVIAHLGLSMNDPAGHAAEPFEGTAVAAEPGCDRLVAHDLGVLVARPAQRHHEHPGLEHLAGVHVGDLGPGAEVDLRGLGRIEVQAHRRAHLGLRRSQLLPEAPHRGVAAGVAMVATQPRVHRRALQPLRAPLANQRGERHQRRDRARCHARWRQRRAQHRVVGQRLRRIQPAHLLGALAQLADLLAAHQPRPRDVAIGIALAQPHQNLSILEHLESPSAHRTPPDKSGSVRPWSSNPAQPTLAPICRSSGGAITPILTWRQYGDPGLAPLRRS